MKVKVYLTRLNRHLFLRYQRKFWYLHPLCSTQRLQIKTDVFNFVMKCGLCIVINTIAVFYSYEHIYCMKEILKFKLGISSCQLCEKCPLQKECTIVTDY